ncbi:MAG TPA: hypothetical protein VF160_09605 [Candidatus Dormibacteraeota bacterium]
MGDKGGYAADVQEVQAVRRGLEDLARSLHASYLNRWGRHDPAGLERQAVERAEREGTGQRISAA